jgi:hypothetical protein
MYVNHYRQRMYGRTKSSSSELSDGEGNTNTWNVEKYDKRDHYNVSGSKLRWPANPEVRDDTDDVYG